MKSLMDLQISQGPLVGRLLILGWRYKPIYTSNLATHLILFSGLENIPSVVLKDEEKQKISEPSNR